MKRLFAVLAGAVGLGAWLRRRRHRATPEEDPADQLRTKLAESKAAEAPGAAEPEPTAAPEAVAEPDADPAGVDDRRASVHDRARKAIDELSG